MELRQHQIDAVVQAQHILDKHGVAFISGEQRTGKTIVGLALANGAHLRSKADGGEVLVITRKKAMESISSDSEAFLGHAEWMTVVNYESCHKVSARDWAMVILDEVHTSGMGSYPKHGKYWKLVAEHCKNAGAVVGMSGTLFPESMAQAFGIMRVTGRGLWRDYKDFYAWWHHPGHYKRPRLCGGYGVPGAKKRVMAGQEVDDYSQVNEDKVRAEVAPFCVKITRREAGFQYDKAKVVSVQLDNNNLVGVCDRIMKHGVWEGSDKEGVVRTCVYESPAAKLQGAHMACGGTLIDEDGEPFILGEEFNPYYRAHWIHQNAKPGKKYAIQTAWIHERQLLLNYLPMATDSLEEFRQGDYRFWVASLMSFSMGVDLSWISGTQILYSIPFSGAHYSQVKDRQLKYDRTRPALVGVPLLNGGMDNYVFQAVNNKMDFNLAFYKSIRGGCC